MRSALRAYARLASKPEIRIYFVGISLALDSERKVLVSEFCISNFYLMLTLPLSAIEDNLRFPRFRLNLRFDVFV